MKTHQDASSLPQPPSTLNTGSNGNTTQKTNWRNLDESERRQALAHFFQRWSAPAKDLTECPPDAELLLAAKEPDVAKWPAHIQNCSRCRQLTELVSNPNRVRIPINEILAMSSQIADEDEQSTPVRSFTPRAYVNAFYNSLTPMHVGAATVALIFAISLTIGLYVRSAFQPSEPTYVVSLPEDGYGKATEWLRQAKTILDSDLGAQDKLNQLKPLKEQQAQIRQTINGLDKRSMDGTQRAELGTLLASYNSQIQILAQSTATPKNERENIPMVAQTADSKIVTQVWAAFGSTKSEPLIIAESQDINTAKAIVQASKETDVTSITEKGEVVVNDHLVERSEEEKAQIQERVEKLEKHEGVTVTINWSASAFKSATAPRADVVSPKLAGYQPPPK